MKKLLTVTLVFTLLSLLFIPFVNADQSVSATVPPRISDFQFSFSSSNLQTITPTQYASYQITYSSLPSANMPTTITLTASWNGITAPDNSQLFDYAVGSATNGYGGAVPVVNLVNKTITWTMPNVPAGTTDQTVNFKLRPITSYANTNSFPFTISARMSNQFFSLPSQTLPQTFQPKTPLQQSIQQPTMNPTQTITPTPTPSLTATPSASPLFQITSVTVTGLSDSGATIQTTSNEPTKLELRYGTTPTTLTKTVTTNTYITSSTMNLTGLEADNTYYFQLAATNTDGKTISSDIFSFHTAKPSAPPNLENNIIILSSSGNVLDSASQKENDLKNPSIILTNSSDYTISYALANPIPLKSIEVVVINKVLGASTLAAANGPSEFIFPMTQKTPTLYVTDLQTVPQGVYEVDVRVIDTNGNIIQKQISSLKIMPKLTVYGADTHNPLSDARIYITYYDEQTKKYQPVTSALFGNIKNPSYTDAFGQSSITLPAGEYRIEESSLFYDSQVRDFTIGPGVNQNFPILYLKKDPLNLISLFMYTKEYFGDSWAKMLMIIVATASSVRIYHLIALEILATFVCLTFFFFLFRAHLSLKHLPIFISFHLNFLFKKHDNRYIFGSIVDSQNNPITRVLIEIEDTKTNNIITHGSSHKSGKFYFTNMYEHPISLLFIKDGYEPITIRIDNKISIPKDGLRIKMEKGTPHHETVFSAFIQGLEEGFGMLFETFLVSSLLLELFFFVFLSHQATLPFFFMLSLINILLWMFYLKERPSRD